MDIDDLKMQTLTQHETPARSQARARYAPAGPRPASRPSRPRPPLKQPEIRTWRERAIFQAIICGGFLAVLLVFNVIDSTLTNNVTAWVDRNLSYDIFAEDGVGGWTDRLLGIFNNDTPTPDYADIEPFPQAPAIPTGTSNTPDSWIDPGVLEEIHSEGN